MRKITKVFLFIIVSSFLISCNTTTEQESITLSKKLLSTKLLNSERIKEKFGSYDIDVLSHTNKVRISNLYSFEEGTKVTRTFAVVNYPEQIDSSYAAIHSKVIKGASIGRIFKKNRWSIVKVPLYKGTIPTKLKEFSYVYDLMSIQKNALAFYMYDFHIQKDGNDYKYATITEIYHPQYINTKTLELLYKEQQIPIKKTPQVNQILNIVYAKMQSK
ncbi:hypothetical protein RQM59_13385 [Flavobacteriaceae bacterium S356]|uniref:Lipoprotein n=1 Tax=Asprobacillus argus TaxID=3076534 RepID=A0ABU3LI55_9FLAO|nr:hypothetical protein [Flavobacteriaceae bacterium S356]